MYDDDDDDENGFEPDAKVDVANGGITITIPRLPVSESDIIRGISKHFADKLSPVIQQKLEEITEGAFADAINRESDKLLRELLSKPQHKTSQWGEPTGEPVTMREYLADRFELYMKQSVDREGRPSNYDSDKKRTRSQWLIETLGEKLVLNAAKVEVEKVRKAAESQISAAVAHFIATKLATPAVAPLLPDGL